MPATVVAASSFDDMVAITGYTIFINIAVQGTSDQAWHIAQVPSMQLLSTDETAGRCMSILHVTTLLRQSCSARCWRQAPCCVLLVLAVRVIAQGSCSNAMWLTRVLIAGPPVGGVWRHARRCGRNRLQCHPPVEQPVQAHHRVVRVR